MTFDHLVRQVREGRLWTRGTPPVAIIGAGISGLAAYRAMLSEGILPIVLEQCHEAGGVWSILPHFTTYDGLIQNTSARQMALDGLAVPRPRHGDHFSREEYASYVHAYSESIYSRTRIFKGCKVQSIAREPDGATLAVRRFRSPQSELVAFEVDHVIYAGGSLHTPYLDPIPGIEKFRGLRVHSTDLGAFPSHGENMESHISLHSWPEYEYAAIDIFTCGRSDPHVALDYLRNALRPSRVEVHELLRGISPTGNASLKTGAIKTEHSPLTGA